MRKSSNYVAINSGVIRGPAFATAVVPNNKPSDLPVKRATNCRQCAMSGAENGS